MKVPPGRYRDALVRLRLIFLLTRDRYRDMLTRFRITFAGEWRDNVARFRYGPWETKLAAAIVLLMWSAYPVAILALLAFGWALVTSRPAQR